MYTNDWHDYLYTTSIFSFHSDAQPFALGRVAQPPYTSKFTCVTDFSTVLGSSYLISWGSQHAKHGTTYIRRLARRWDASAITAIGDMWKDTCQSRCLEDCRLIATELLDDT